MKNLGSIPLSPGWRIAWDDHQWIVQKRYVSRKIANKATWTPVGYVGSTKSILLRELRKNGAVIGVSGLASLQELPETFKEFILATGRKPEWATRG